MVMNNKAIQNLIHARIITFKFKVFSYPLAEIIYYTLNYIIWVIMR